MYIKINKNKIESKWLSKPSIYSQLSDQELEKIGVYFIDIPAHDPYINFNFNIDVVDNKPVYTSTSVPISLSAAKKHKISIVDKQWRDALIKGHFISSTVSGFDIDCRRYDVHNDFQNIEGKIKRVESGIEQEPILWKGVSEIRQISLAELKLIQLEMIEYVNTIYGRKFVALAQIESATTIDQIKAIEF